MSTASDDVSSHNTESKGPIPTDIDNQPILDLLDLTPANAA